MNVKSMLVGFLIAVVASTGTYFLVPPPSGAIANKNNEALLVSINEHLEFLVNFRPALDEDHGMLSSKIGALASDLDRRLTGIESAQEANATNWDRQRAMQLEASTIIDILNRCKVDEDYKNCGTGECLQSFSLVC